MSADVLAHPLRNRVAASSRGFHLGLSGLSRGFPVGLIALCLAACATAPDAGRDTAVGEGPIRAFHLSGRLSIRQEQHNDTAVLDWQHDPAADRLILRSPLGSQVMLLEEQPGHVRLTLPDRAPVEAADDTALMQSLLGYSLPVQGLAEWVLGRLAPETLRSSEGSGESRVDHFEQDGWRGVLQRWRVVGQETLPGLISLERPGLQLKLVVDQWTVQHGEP